MPYKIHERDLRGKTQTGWLDSKHTFSFGDFRDPKRMGFRSLRVINDDIITPGSGFATHPHENMEIITYVISGALEHKDSMGNGSIIKAGEFQIMSAGTGVTHSEFNPSNDNKGHFLQIWIRPNERGLTPSYDQIFPILSDAKDKFIPVGTPEGGENIVKIHQDAHILMARPPEGQDIFYKFTPGRHGFLQVVKGKIDIDGEILKEGDGLEISDLIDLHIIAKADSELMLFDLA